MKVLTSLFKATLVVAAISMFSTSCKKDSAKSTTTQTPYEKLTRADVVTANSTLSGDRFTVSTSDALYMKKGDVFIYQTKSGLYGKMQIDTLDVENNYAITFDATTYAADGSVSKTVTALTINGVHTCDLDALVEVSNEDDYDFFLNRHTETDTYMYFYNNATFASYSFDK